MIFVEDNDLELVKLIKTKDDEEFIYKLKNSNLNNSKFLIIIETIPQTNSGNNLYRCMKFDTIENAIRQANIFIYIRKFIKHKL